MKSRRRKATQKPERKKSARVQTGAIPFTKMHGLGNDFVIIDACKSSPVARKVKNPEKWLGDQNLQLIGDRRFGVGFDQLLLLQEPDAHSNPRGVSTIAHVEMLIYNPDGSQALMCGNGIRAAALYLITHHAKYRKFPAQKKSLRIQTAGGLKEIHFVRVQNDWHMKVNMEAPVFHEKNLELAVHKHWVKLDHISIGNPHAVVPVAAQSQLSRLDFKRESFLDLAPQIESHSHFPDRANVEFVRKVGPQSIEVLVYERGAGWTLACGSGATASACAMIARGEVKGPVQVKLPGGELTIEWSGLPTDAAYMQGPAVEVFHGILNFGA